jgi:hypothetical protein
MVHISSAPDKRATSSARHEGIKFLLSVLAHRIDESPSVRPAKAGIHVLLLGKTWMAGTSPAMTGPAMTGQ